MSVEHNIHPYDGNDENNVANKNAGREKEFPQHDENADRLKEEELTSEELLEFRKLELEQPDVNPDAIKKGIILKREGE